MNRRAAPTDLFSRADTRTDTRLRKRLGPTLRRLRFRRSGRLPLLVLLALGAAVGAALIGPSSADPAQAQSPAAQSVPSDWALIPDGIEPGDSFRLIFVTSTTRDASSTNISDYNSHAQSAAAGNSNLAGFSSQFRALISTSSVDARDNTATTGTGVSVHWLGGGKAADDYADLYDGTWDSVSGRTEAGGSYTGLAWTGGNKAGLKSGLRHAGAAEVRVGDLSDLTLALSSPAAKAATEQYPLYAVSPVITVAQPEAESLVVDTDPLQEDSAESPQAPATQTVPADWPLIPDGIEPGDSFRLLSVTRERTDASSSNIADYNAHAQRAADAHVYLKPYKDGFTALISTAGVDVRDNTATTGAGVPIYWLGHMWDWRAAEKVADDYADFYDGSWDSVSGARYPGLVWTGSSQDGRKSEQHHAGAATVQLGDLTEAGEELSSDQVVTSSATYPLYALSPVFTVAEPVPAQAPEVTAWPRVVAGPAIVSPAHPVCNSYGPKETIDVSITFSEPVTVTGEPQLRLSVGERNRWANYSSTNGATLTFAYTAKAVDHDDDGVSIDADALKLNGGAIVDVDGNAADLSAPALSDQDGHRVNGAAERSGCFPQRSYTFTIPENTPIGAHISAEITARDHDDDRFGYTLAGADAESFYYSRHWGAYSYLNRLRATALKIILSTNMDYETKQTYEFTLSSHDETRGQMFSQESIVDTVPVSVTITDVDEAGTVGLDVFKPYYDEWKRPFRDVIQIWTATPVTATLSDPDSGVGEVSWQWYSAASGWNQFRDLELGPSVSQAGPWTALSGNGADTNIYTPQHADANKWLRATATYTDVHGAGKVVHGYPGAPVNPDQLRPEVWLSYEKANVNAPFDITINWMEEVIGFDQSDVDLTNATLSNWARSGLNYTATITPTAEGGVYIGIDENAATDMFNNTSTALYPVAGFNYDITPPTITFQDSPGPFTRAETFYLTIDPSENLLDHEVPYTVDDLVVVNGTASDFGPRRFRSQRSYEVLITPDEGLTHGEKITVTVPTGVWSDWAGNATAQDFVFTTEIDLVPPTATITVRSLDEVDSHGYFTVDIEFSEPVKKPETGDVWQEVYGRLSTRDFRVRNGRVTSMERQFPVVRQTRYTTTWLSTSSGDLFESLTEYPVSWGAIYIATVAPDKGHPKVGSPIVIWFPRGTVEDQAGNVNSEPIGRTQVLRTDGPTVTVEGAPLGERRSQPDEPFKVTVSFSEDVVGFDAKKELEVSGGTVTASKRVSATSEPDVFSVTIDPDGPGRVSIKVPAEVARSKTTRDLNHESNTLRYTVVATGPTVALRASDAEDPNEVAERVNHPFNIKVSFSDEMVGFKAASEMEVSGGSITMSFPISEKGEPTELLVEITPDGVGMLEVKVPAEVARSKESRRLNAESNTLTFNIVAVSR